MKQARIIPCSLERPDGTIAEWFEFELAHGDHWHRDKEQAFRTRLEAVQFLEGRGVVVVEG